MAVAGLITVGLVALGSGIVSAFPGFLTTWGGKYPASMSDDNAGCYLCHGTSTSNWNAYGNAVKQEYDTNGGNISAAIDTVASDNSDSDAAGASNAKEANANTQPGWMYGNNNTIYNSSGGVISSNQPPNSSVTGKLDPVTLVEVGDDTFTPATVATKVGKPVFWTRETGSTGTHNVAELGDIFRSGDPGTGAINFLVRFSAGTFKYECEDHATQTGTVKVKPKVNKKPRKLPFTVIWATGKTDSGTQYDVRYRVGSGKWKIWLGNASAVKKVFGAKNKPVTLKKGMKYSFRVRSESATASSKWSPIASFKP